MRKTPTLTITFFVCLIALTALGAIIRYTDKPNSIPVGSDFFSLQRNQDYINASVNQFSNMLYTSPNFTGNGSISGNWVAGGIYYGNGAGISNVATAVYFLSTNGVGQNPTFYGGGNFFGVYYFDEVDALNFYPTNFFTGDTNFTVLGTDGNGQFVGRTVTGSGTTVVMSGGPTITNTTIKGDQYATNAFFFTTWGGVLSNNINQVVISNGTIYATGPIRVTGETNTATTASTLDMRDANKAETSLANGTGFLSDNGSGTFTYSYDMKQGTNFNYSLPTNNVGGGAFVFGGPGTAATLYDTNITTATTLKPFDITACSATAGGLKIYATCSGGTDRILTFPPGCSGAGLGIPPAVTITNGKAAFFDVIYKPGATPVTNVFWSPVY